MGNPSFKKLYYLVTYQTSAPEHKEENNTSGLLPTSALLPQLQCDQ